MVSMRVIPQETTPRQFFDAMRGLVLDEKAICIREKIQIVVDHSRELLDRPSSVDEEFLRVQTVTDATIHLFVKVNHCRFLLIVPTIRNFRIVQIMPRIATHGLFALARVFDWSCIKSRFYVSLFRSSRVILLGALLSLAKF